MTKKDFELIARVLHEHIAEADDEHAGHVDYVARDFAHELASTNPRFDRARFLRACGVETTS